MPLELPDAHFDLLVPKIVRATLNFEPDPNQVVKSIYSATKSKSLDRSVHSKKEINHRLIPEDILLDAKPNYYYKMTRVTA